MASDVKDRHSRSPNRTDKAAEQSPTGSNGNGPGGALSGLTGVAAGAGAAALAPLAWKGMEKLARSVNLEQTSNFLSSPSHGLQEMASTWSDRLTSSATEVVQDKVEQAGGAGGMLKKATKAMLSAGGGSGSAGQGGISGVGKGRRMPIQQAVEIGLPVETVYNQYTQFEEWPTFMHRVTRVTQDDDCTVTFATKIWGKTKEFTAEIETQRPNERIKWKVSRGMTHSGVVSFHELTENSTLVLLNFDVQPGSLAEKFARGARLIKRAARADLHRFKAFIEMTEQETGAWRGVIEEGEVVEEHDPDYNPGHEYSDIEAATGDADDEDAAGQDESEEEPGQQSKPATAASSSRRADQPDQHESRQRRSPRARRPESSSRTRGSASKDDSQDRPKRSASNRSRTSSHSDPQNSRSGSGRSRGNRK